MRSWATRLFLVWVAGLVTAVPWAAHRLMFVAPREEYAALITFVLFWVFGYWPTVGPLAAALRLHRLFGRLTTVQSQAELDRLVGSPEAEDTAVELLADDTGLPRFLARRLFRKLRAFHAERRAGGADRS